MMVGFTILEKDILLNAIKYFEGSDTEISRLDFAILINKIKQLEEMVI